MMIDELEIEIRKQLIKQAEVNPEQVKNALSRYGSHFTEEIDYNVFDSVGINSILMFFELMTQESSSDVSMEESDGTISYFKSFYVPVICYGSDAIEVTHKLRARLLSEKVRNDFQQKQIYLESVSHPSENNEFINNVLWPRTDFNIYIKYKLTIDQIDKDSYFESIGLNIKEV